jgi:tartrate-resistant acid phosphatase type 5
MSSNRSVLVLLVLVAACGSDTVGGGNDGDGGSGPGADGGTVPDSGNGGDVDGGPGTPDASVPPGTQRVSFIAIGDTGEGNTDQRKVAEAMRDVCAARGCDFVLMLGDNIYDRGVIGVDDPQWQQKFEDPYRDVDLPFYAALGNHDYGGSILIPIPGLGNEWDRGMHEVSYSQHSTKWIMPAHHYTFTHGHVGFIVLDTNSLMWSDTTYGDQKTWWPTALLDVQDSEWVFVVGHHPYRSNGSHGNAGNYDTPEGIPNPLPNLNGASLKQFFDDVVCGTGDAYFSGHDHSRQWLDMPASLCGTELIVSGAGCKVSTIQERGNQKFYQDASEPGFMYVDIVGKKFTGVFYDADGNVDFERSFEKP